MRIDRYDLKVPEPPGGVPIDYAAIESLDEYKALVADVHVIWVFSEVGVDIIYGRNFLQHIADGTIPPQNARELVFAIDARTNQLEHIIAATMHAKGFHEYDGVIQTLGGDGDGA